MPEPHFATLDDDLPRTFRREREARERDAREREAQERETAIIEPAFLRRDTPHQHRHTPETVTEDRLQIGFLRLMVFCIKAVFAAIPAILILAVLLWLGGQALATFFPQLPRMQILIHFPK